MRTRLEAPARFTSLKLTWDSVSTATSYNVFRELSASGNFTAKLDEYKRDHSLYIAAAPIEAPTVVLAVVVENAGFGAAAAAPIARRVFDYLLLGHWPSEEDMAATREGRSAAPRGTPRVAAEVPLPGRPATPDNAAAAALAMAGQPAAPAQGVP